MPYRYGIRPYKLLVITGTGVTVPYRNLVNLGLASTLQVFMAIVGSIGWRQQFGELCCNKRVKINTVTCIHFDFSCINKYASGKAFLQYRTHFSM